MNSMRRRQLFALALAAALLLVADSIGSRGKASRPLVSGVGCLRKTDHGRVVRFRTTDGIRLRGIQMGRGNKGLVLSHEYRATFCNWIPFAREAVRRGYRVLAYNSRARSLPANVAARQDLDVAAAASTLRRAGASEIALLGASAGATSSLVAAADITPEVKGVVSLSAAESFDRLDAKAAVANLDVPILFMATQHDDLYAAAAKTLYEDATTHDKDLQILSGDAHGTQMIRLPYGRTARNLIFAFLAGHL
jgi:dienelactone hydrolase